MKFYFQVYYRYSQIVCATNNYMGPAWSSLKIESRFSTRLRKPIINHEFHTFGRVQERKPFQKDAEGLHSVGSDPLRKGIWNEKNRGTGISLGRANVVSL